MSNKNNNNPTKVALAAKSHRVYGCIHNNSKDGDSQHDGVISSSLLQQQQLRKICTAVETAMSEDAGGFGTCGFHKTKVENLRQLSSSNSTTGIDSNRSIRTIYRADLIPCHPDTGAPLDFNAAMPATNHQTDGDAADSSEVAFSGNDAFYLNDCSNCMGTPTAPSRFQIQITVSNAAEGVYAKKFHEALYSRGRRAVQDGLDASPGCIGGVAIEELVAADDELRVLKQKIDNCAILAAAAAANDDDNLHVRFERNDGDKLPPPRGFYVQVMMLEPHIGEKDAAVVIAPPSDLDKASPAYRPFGSPSAGDDVNAEGDKDNIGCIFQSIFTSPQYNTLPGPWEQSNIKAFQLIALDVRKALVRVEFPEFEEGCKDKTFREVYQLNARLKSGSFATVCRGTHRATGRKIAVKCVLREDLPPNDDAAIYDEVLILSTLKHPLICPLIDFFEERECYFLVMELMSGGDLFDRIGQKKNYNERDARTLCRKMLESVRYCHENSVAHRDMKPKNLLLVDEDDDCAIKLGDFGFATRVYEPKSLTKQCGTPFFIAPEVLLRTPYDQQSDMWSVGVIMYLLLAGDLPFTGRTQKELFRNIVKGEYEFSSESWSNVSPDAKDLLCKLLVTDPSHRITAREALASPWMRKRDNMLLRNSLLYTSQRLKTFNARMKLKSAMIAVSAVTSAQLSLRRSLKQDSIDELEGVDENAGGEKKRREPSFMKLPMVNQSPMEGEEYAEEDGAENDQN